ncbi:MAG: hypothetical protein DRO23_00630 [Thermoprotei archaeon]|nr:MAG: hypothetical protein DRO23_00630 [Thermoprotei archaeon]
MDLWLLLRIAVYIMGGILPFLYNYYYVKKKVKKGRQAKNSSEENLVVNNFYYSSDAKDVSAGDKNVIKESIEPITIVSSTSIASPHAYDDRSGSTPLYVVLLVDHNVMKNPDALSKIVLNVPKIVDSMESRVHRE